MHLVPEVCIPLSNGLFVPYSQAIAEDKMWTIIDDSVYDLEHYINEHPGGPKVLENIVGK